MLASRRVAFRLFAATAALILLAAAVPAAHARSYASASLSSVASTNLGGACCKPCISYKYHHRCRKVCCDCKPPVRTTLQVKDPCCCGCTVDIPVCLPSCCTCKPCVSCHCGVLGRGIVEYSWSCGYRVKVVFDRHGDVTVHSYGS